MGQVFRVLMVGAEGNLLPVPNSEGLCDKSRKGLRYRLDTWCHLYAGRKPVAFVIQRKDAHEGAVFENVAGCYWDYNYNGVVDAAFDEWTDGTVTVWAI